MAITLIGWFGIVIGFAAVFLIAGRERDTKRVMLVLLLAAVQTAVGFYFHHWVQTGTSDASLYYFDPYDWYELNGFGLSTNFVIWMVQGLKESIGGTYLDFFLLFQATGTWGAVFLLKTFEDLHGMARVKMNPRLLLVLFLPGIHFWTAFIGKDGFLFLGGAIAVWSAINIRQRWLPFAIGVVFMVLFRPHIAGLAVASIAVAVFFDRDTHGPAKIALGAMALVGVAAVASTIQSTFQLDVTNTEAVSEIFARQAKAGDITVGTTNVIGGGFLLKLFSLLFRPLFFDAGGFDGLVASAENLVLLGMFVYAIRRRRWLLTLCRGVLAVRYAAIFAFGLTVVLTLSYYNVGLGLRQKMMMMPALLTIFCALVATERVTAPRTRPRRAVTT